MILQCSSLRTISLEQWSSTVGRQLVPPRGRVVMARDIFGCCHWSCYWYLVHRGQDARDSSASHKHNMSVVSRVRSPPWTHVPQDLETCLRMFMVTL